MKHILFLAALILTYTFAAGQNKVTSKYKRCPLKIINVETGLLNNTILDIITDSLGLTWFSTQTGMQRFNGYRLQTITPVAGKDSFYINSPVKFFALQNGAIWISCKRGILEYSPASNSFTHLITLAEEDKLYYSIVPLKETAEGIWCMQLGKGIVLYNRKGILQHQFAEFGVSLITDIINSAELRYRKTTVCNDEYIFINDGMGQVLSINTKTREFKKIASRSSDFFGMACTRDNLFIIDNQKLCCFNIHDGALKRTTLLNVITSNAIIAGGLCLVDNNQLLAAINNHLYEFDTLGIYRKEYTDLSRNPVLATGYIWQVYLDKYKRIWVLTNNDVRRIQNFEIPFAHFIYPDAKNNFVKCLYYDEQKHIIIAGCFNGGLQLYDTLSNPLWAAPLITNDVKDIITIEKLTDDEYLLLTFNKGMYLLQLSTRRTKPLKLTAAIAAKLHAEKIYFGNRMMLIAPDTMLLSTTANVFRCVFNGSSLVSATALLPPNSGSGYINSFCYSLDKTLWIGTVLPILYRLDKDGTLQTFQIPENYLVRSITEDGQHNIWVGTDKGLCIYTSSGRLIKRITAETGLLNDCIYSLLPDADKAAVFASSNLGLSYVSVAGKIKNFSRESGLQENEFNTGAAIRTTNGRYYFAGVNGITAFYPAALSFIVDTPVIHITKLVINDSLYNSSAGTWEGDSVLLNHNQNHLRIDLAALGLLNANEYIYKYRLVGFEKTWQTTYQPLGINYTLVPGTYVLEISCSPILSEEKTFYKKIVIIISPPWWQTWWFTIMAIILTIGLITFILQQFNHRKYLQKIRLLQVQQQIQRDRERISRDLHDDIGAKANMLAYNVSLLGKTVSEEELKQVKRRMKGTSDDMMQSLRETVWTLKQENITAEDVWTRFKNFMAKLQQTYSLIQFTIEEDELSAKKINYNEALNLIRILQEAVNNAIKHSGCKTICCSRFNAEQVIIFTIKDDGHGFDAAAAESLLNEGNGLQNMKQRAQESGFIFSIDTTKNDGTTITIKV